MKKIVPLIFVASLLLCGCASTPPYAKYDSDSQTVGDNTIRYGAPVVLGGGVGYGVAEATGKPVYGVMAGTGVAAATYGLEKLSDSQKMRAYQAGVNDGATSARAEIANEDYRRESVYGIKPGNNGVASAVPEIRDVHVGPRTENGVVYPAQDQRVSVYDH